MKELNSTSEGSNVDAVLLGRIQESLAVKFENPALLESALTPFAGPAEKKLRLEFETAAYRGLSLLNWLMADYVCRESRSKLEADALHAAMRGLGARGEAAIILGLLAHQNVTKKQAASYKSGAKTSVLLTHAAYLLSALMTALYDDGGEEKARAFFVDQLVPLLPVAAPEADFNAYEWLRRLVMAEREVIPLCSETEASVQLGARRFAARVIVEDEVWGEGAGRNKKSAKSGAICDALQKCYGVTTTAEAQVKLSELKAQTEEAQEAPTES